LVGKWIAIVPDTPQSAVPSLQPGDEKFNSRPVAPTTKLNSPSSIVVQGCFSFQGGD
jgi:hypothetical protein